jgi:Flp pilus assembly protein TadG
MCQSGGAQRRTSAALGADRRGVAAVEAALIMLTFITLLFMVIEVGIYFIMQSSLDIAVLSASETIRTAMQLSSAYSPPNAATLKGTIVTNGGAMLTSSTVAVDVNQLSTLSAGAVTVTDGSTDWGSSGSVVIVRATATMTFQPSTLVLTAISTAILRRPAY